MQHCAFTPVWDSAKLPVNHGNLKENKRLGLSIKSSPICRINSRQDVGYLSEKISLYCISQSLLITSVYPLGLGVISDHQALGHAV